jgi:phage shock protein PspC (stress-responsive transcriptional regulator)
MAENRAAIAICMAGLTCGVMDITAALLVYGSMGLKPLRLLQGIAGGILGPRAYSGGVPTALLGLFLHFVIAFGAATVFFLASRAVRFLTTHALVSGVLYGIAVYFFMNRVVVQLSAATKRPFSPKMMLIGMVIHIFCVGLPISLSIRKYLR